MRALPILTALVLAATPLAASEVPEAPKAPTPEVVEARRAAPALPHREIVPVPESRPAEAPAEARALPRGSFWWTVAVIVVAGVILALVL